VPRVKCLNALMAYVTDAKQKPLIRQILPEVILSVREVNQKSRDSSLALLNSMLRLWQKLGAEATPPLNEAGLFLDSKSFRFIYIGFIIDCEFKIRLTSLFVWSWLVWPDLLIWYRAVVWLFLHSATSLKVFKFLLIF
jgi:hypothetical protein